MERRRRDQDRAAEDTTILEESSEEFDRATDEAVLAAEEGVVYSQEAITADEESDDPPGVPEQDELAEDVAQDAPTGATDLTPNDAPPSVADETSVISETVTAAEPVSPPGPAGPDPTGGGRAHNPLDVFEMGLGLDQGAATDAKLNIGETFTRFNDNGSVTYGIVNSDGSSTTVTESSDGMHIQRLDVHADGTSTYTVTNTFEDGSSATTTWEYDEDGKEISSKTEDNPPEGEEPSNSSEPEGETGEASAEGGDGSGGEESSPPPEEDEAKPDAGQPDRFTEDGPGLGPGGQMLEGLGEWARAHTEAAMAGSNVTPTPEGAGTESGEPMWDVVPSVAIPPDDLEGQSAVELPDQMPAPGGNTDDNINWGPDHVEASEPATDNSQFEERSASEIVDGGLEEEIAEIDDQRPPADKGADLDASQTQPDLTIVEEDEDKVTRETSDDTQLDIDDAYPRHEFGAPSDEDGESVQLDLDGDESLQETVRAGDYELGTADMVDDVIPASSDLVVEDDELVAGQERSSEGSTVAQPQVEMPTASGDPVPRQAGDDADQRIVEADEPVSTDRVASGDSEPTTPSAANTDAERSAEPDSELDDLIFSGDSEPTTPSVSVSETGTAKSEVEEAVIDVEPVEVEIVDIEISDDPLVGLEPDLEEDRDDDVEI